MQTPPPPPPGRNVLSPPPPPPGRNVLSPPPPPAAGPRGVLSPPILEHESHTSVNVRSPSPAHEVVMSPSQGLQGSHGSQQGSRPQSRADDYDDRRGVSHSPAVMAHEATHVAQPAAELSLEKISPLIEKISEKYLASQLIERKRNDELQLNAINSALKKWAEQVNAEIKKTQSSQSSGVDKANAILDSAVGDSRDRQSKIIEEIKEAHKKQLDILRQAMAEERQLAQQAQQVFEETLQTKYDSMVSALQVKIRAEQEASMQRALADLEKSARAEGERARQAFEVQQDAEAAIAAKFKSIVGDLRKSWEEEEASRAKQLEERLRGHYSAVLEHMEAQLQMALQLQDDADRQWMEDVEARNRQQVSTIKAFEEKCRRLYDTRLAEYAERTDQQLAKYEDQLLEAGSALVAEKSKFDSKQRRLKIACNRWKLEYQREVHANYQETIGLMEEKYMNEISRLLEELAFARSSTSQAIASTESKEKELFREKLGKTKSDNVSKSVPEDYVETPTSQAKKRAMREELTQRWQDLGTPVEERVLILASILDAAPLTPALTAKYETVLAKLAARMPIMQMLSRKQYLEYKLKLSQRPTNSGDALSVTSKSELTQELQDLVANIETATKQYEIRYSERFVRPPTILPGSTASLSSIQAQPAPATAGGGSSVRGTATADTNTASNNSVLGRIRR